MNLKEPFIAAVMREAESNLKWTVSATYKGDWMKDIQRAKETIEAAEKICRQIELVFAENGVLPDA